MTAHDYRNQPFKAELIVDHINRSVLDQLADMLTQLPTADSISEFALLERTQDEIDQVLNLHEAVEYVGNMLSMNNTVSWNGGIEYGFGRSNREKGVLHVWTRFFGPKGKGSIFCVSTIQRASVEKFWIWDCHSEN